MAKPETWTLKGRLILLAILPVCCAGIALSCFRQLHTYLIEISPYPKSAQLDGTIQPLGVDGAFIFNEFFGTHVVDVVFKDGSRTRVALFPRASDDDSSSLTIYPNGKVVGHGDLRFKVRQE